MKKEIKVLAKEQMNPSYNPNKARDGGGYNQPRITFSYGEKVGIFIDTSCGDFGVRLDLLFDGYIYSFNTVDDPDAEVEYSNFPTEGYEAFLVEAGQVFDWDFFIRDI